MGKRIISQRRGRGTSRYKSPSHRFVTKVSYTFNSSEEIGGKVTDIINCPGHSSPLMVLRLDDGSDIFNFAPLGIQVGDSIAVGTKAVNTGNVVSLSDLPEGTQIYNIESQPGDGGKFVRSSGATAKVLTKSATKAVILMPSKKKREFPLKSRATVGIIAGGGRLEKPFVKAGNKFFKMKAKNKLWPRTEGVKMNAVDHPFGNSASGIKGKPTIARKHAPPGAKVGKIRPRRTGKKVGRASDAPWCRPWFQNKTA